MITINLTFAGTFGNRVTDVAGLTMIGLRLTEMNIMASSNMNMAVLAATACGIDFIYNGGLFEIATGNVAVVDTDVNFLGTFGTANSAGLVMNGPTKTDKPMAFIVDARAGRSSRLSGQVASNLRSGFVVQTANMQGDSTPELILDPSHERSGRISVIDLQARKVLCNATDFVVGGMKIKLIGAEPTGHSEFSSFQTLSLSLKNTFKVLDAASGKVLESVSANTRRAEKHQAMKAEKMQSVSIASVWTARQTTTLPTLSIPSKRLSVINLA